MSLTALIYNHRNTIVSSRDLQNVMKIGNELYTSLSRLSKQTYLLLTELPEIVCVFESNYHYLDVHYLDVLIIHYLMNSYYYFSLCKT